MTDHTKEDLRLFGNERLIGDEGADFAPPASPATSTQSTGASSALPAQAFNNYTWWFQLDLVEYSLPRFDVAKLQSYAPRHYKGPGHETFATLYASRDSSMLDPYFLATQQIIYRLLWDPRSRSNEHPVTVFVAPFITAEQRRYFTAAGAIVREVDLVPFEPVESANVAARLMDMFSKLEMWNQTEFSRIAYLDSDAFPVVNIDEIFDLAPTQMCKEKLLPREDRAHAKEICPYVFTGYMENDESTNAGVLVFQPNRAMHARLLRDCQDKTKFDNGLAEQAFLNTAFHRDGPFPPSKALDQRWNISPDAHDRGEEISILHAKLWATWFEEDNWAVNLFNHTWKDMLHLYESPDFELQRAYDSAPQRPDS